jgi:peptidoglycan hydrolase-like protein with peptidoglycan-binding domain
MGKRLQVAGSGLLAAVLLTTGVAVSELGGHSPAKARLTASKSATTFANLDNCPTLAQGYHGGCVDQLQTELNDVDHANLGVDGTFGSTTRQAVITFQQQNAVSPADGIVGPQTKQALDRVAGTSTTPATPATSGTSAPLSSANLGACPVLAQGYQGGCIDELQSELNFDENANLSVDGTFGPTTRQAVITFQQQNGVSPADGLVGPQTKQALVNADSVPTPQPGAPLSPFEICQQKEPGSVSDGHGGCTPDGAVALGKSPSECLNEAVTDKANELIAQGYTQAEAESAAAKLLEKGLLWYDAGSVVKCELIDNPDS